MKCINCGKNEAMERGLCAVCITESIKITPPGTYEITVCPKCESVMVGKRWVEENGQSLYEKKLLESISTSDKNGFIDLSQSHIKIHDYKGIAALHISVRRPGLDNIEQDFEIPYKVRKISCPSCNKATGSYYEGKIQIRGYKDENSPLLEKITEFIVRRMDLYSKKSNDSFISSIEKLREGYDIYLGKKNDCDRICKDISRDYFSNLNVSKTLAGMKEGHEIYRYTYSMRVLDLIPGDIIEVNGFEFMLRKTSPQVIYLIDTEKKRDIVMRQNEFFSSRYNIRNFSADKRRFIRISGTDAETVFMDSLDFKQVTLKEAISDPEIDLFLYREEYYRL